MQYAEHMRMDPRPGAPYNQVALHAAQCAGAHTPYLFYLEGVVSLVSLCSWSLFVL